MDVSLAHFTASWASAYANSAPLRTAVGFAHVGGLVASAGPALVMDRAVIRAARADQASRASAAGALSGAHPWVLSGLALVMVSGVLLLGADLDAYLVSPIFWIKMACIAVLAANGAVMLRATAAAAGGRERAWRTLRTTAIISITMWAVITLLGAALPNVG